MPDPNALCQAFARAFEGDLDLDPQQLAPPLLAAIASARSAWPGVEVDPERFVGFLASRIAGDTVLDALARLRTADLWLACSCADGDPAALAAFERAFGGDIEIALTALGVPHDIAEEARQTVRARLFVATPTSEPVITRYGGRGDLRAWVRATTVRAAIDLIRRARREVPSDDIASDDLMPAQDPELALLRERYGAEFRTAFGEALATLSRRDRTLLRYRYIDDLDLDAIGAIYRVHRSSAARWLQQIRDDLLDDTRARLAVRLAVASSEVDSTLRFIGSELDASISSALRK
jgi:RNA polymerase sigma-70 factor (ECF subfamily)